VKGKTESKATQKISKDFEERSKSSKEFDGLVTWGVGESIPYLALANTFEAVSKVPGRLDKESLLCRLFRAIIATTPLELDAIVHLASNSVSPAYEGMELGIGDSILVKAVAAATGRKPEAVKEDYEKEGDLGIVALNSRSSQKTISFAAKPKPLTAKEVLEALRKISKTKGDKAQARKVDIIKGVMVRCQGSEAKYIVRALQGKLRIGTAEQTVLVALAHSFALSPPSKHVSEGEEGKEIKADQIEKTDEIVVVADIKVDDMQSSGTSSSSSGTSSSSKSLIQLIDEVEESEPLEALNLRKGEAPKEIGDGTINDSLKATSSRLTKEGRCELAVIAVKRAFSQCPNLTLLINALLTLPLHKLYQSCRLIPGVPVAPMLAKPTKEVKEVFTLLLSLRVALSTT
jgi:ATP-dependent DNA ligase